MDPISQGAVGAAFAQSTARSQNIAKITLIGCLAGMAPDLDVLIQSRDDPILFLEYHRQFTHSLIFIPLGSLLVSLFVFPFLKGLLNFKIVYIASFLGYATHGLLDACTSYGTQLFWPFSDARIAWNSVSIVDPLFTVPVVILVISGIKTRKIMFSYFAIAWVTFYLFLGFLQYGRAFAAATELAYSRGHRAERLTLKPSFGNLILWKAIYQHEGNYFVDAIRTMYSSTWCSGDIIEVFDFNHHIPSLDKNSQQVKDIERFQWFTQDYLGYDQESGLIIDIRYSIIPNEITPMWGLSIEQNRDLNKHASWWTSRSLDQGQLKTFKSMLTGEACGAF